MPVGAPKMKFEKREVSKAMTSKLPWVAAAIIIVVAAAGAWLILGGAPAVPSGRVEEWRAIRSGTPSQALGYYAGQKSGINAIHFMKHGSGYQLTDNLATYTQSNDNRIGSILASGATIDTFPFDVAFDIVVDVKGHKDNMGQVNKSYLAVSLGLWSDTGLIYLPTDNSLDSTEYVYSSPANEIWVNALWDNTGHTGYILTADDNLHLENIILWLRG
jgi:hypothetical protein